MARVVPVGLIDPELYAFAKKEAEKAERNPRYVPKNCPADRGQIIYKRIGNVVKAIVRADEWGQVSFASSETAFFVANRKHLTTGEIYKGRSSPAVYDPDAAWGLVDSAIATMRLGGYNPDEHLNQFGNQFIYNHANFYERISYPSWSIDWGKGDHTEYCLVDRRSPQIRWAEDFFPYVAKNISHIGAKVLKVQLNNIDIEYYRQDFIDKEVVPKLLRTDRLFHGSVLFYSGNAATGNIFAFNYKKSLSPYPITGVVDGKCYSTYNETHYVIFEIYNQTDYLKKQRISVVRHILTIDGVEQEIGRTTRVEAMQPSPPYTSIEIYNDKSGKTEKTNGQIYMVARCDGGGVYLFENNNVINHIGAYFTLGNEYGVFSVVEREDALQLSWCNSQTMEKMYEGVHWLDDAPIVCNFPKFELKAAHRSAERYGIKTGHSNQIVLFDKFAGKSLDITTMVKKRHASLIDDGAFISQVQGKKWRSFDPGRPVNIITGLIDNDSISGFEYVVNSQKSKDKKITKYIRDNFEVDE